MFIFTTFITFYVFLGEVKRGIELIINFTFKFYSYVIYDTKKMNFVIP